MFASAFACALAVCPLPAQPNPAIETTGAGSIAGTVEDPDGHPVAARVRAVRVRPTRWTGPFVQASARGQFQLTELADGEYVLCAAAQPAGPLADPCFWLDPSSTQPTVRIAGGQPVIGQRARLAEGRRLRVRLKDPQGLLSESQPSSTRGHVYLMLTGPPGSVMMPLPVAQAEGDGYFGEIIVPAAYTPKLQAIGDGVRLSDEQQNPVTATTRQPVPLPASPTGVAEVVLAVSAR